MLCLPSDNTTDKKINYIQKEAFDFNCFKNYRLVDTTGAGDAFTASFAVGLLENQ